MYSGTETRVYKRAPRPEFTDSLRSALSRIFAGCVRRADKAAPFGPRSIVVLYVLHAEQIFQDEPRMARTFADTAIGDRGFCEIDSGRGVEILQFSNSLERAVVIRGLRPGDALELFWMCVVAHDGSFANSKHET